MKKNGKEMIKKTKNNREIRTAEKGKMKNYEIDRSKWQKKKKTEKFEKEENWSKVNDRKKQEN